MRYEDFVIGREPTPIGPHRYGFFEAGGPLDRFMYTATDDVAKVILGLPFRGLSNAMDWAQSEYDDYKNGSPASATGGKSNAGSFDPKLQDRKQSLDSFLNGIPLTGQ